MPNTYTFIANQTVTNSSTSSVSFSSIPNIYDDLVLHAYGRTQTAGGIGQQFVFRFNNDTGANYSATWFRNLSSSMNTFQGTNQTSITGGYVTASNGTANVPGMTKVYFPNYSSTTQFKSYFSYSSPENNTASYDSANYHVAGIYRVTTALSSIQIQDGASNFAPGMTFDLYGIKQS